MNLTGAPGFEIEFKRFWKPEGLHHEAFLGDPGSGRLGTCHAQSKFGSIAPCVRHAMFLAGLKTVPKKAQNGTVSDRP